MSLDVGAAAEVDLGPLSLGAIAGLGATLDGIHETLKNLHRLEEAYQFGGVQVRLSNVASSDSNSDSFEIGLGGPAYGRLWQIRSLVVGGALWTTSVLGSALVVISPSRASAVPLPSPPLTDIVDEAGSLPSVSQYSTGQIVVRHPNHIRIVILTPTASTQYAAGGWATDMPDKRERIEASI
jgi:hypothetical protein